MYSSGGKAAKTLYVSRDVRQKITVIPVYSLTRSLWYEASVTCRRKLSSAASATATEEDMSTKPPLHSNKHTKHHKSFRFSESYLEN